MDNIPSGHKPAPKGTAGIPQQLIKILIVTTAAYFIGFIWTFTGGTLTRLFIPFQWKVFFLERSMAEILNGNWFFYGTSIFDLFRNWIILVSLIGSGYFALGWIRKKDK